MFIVKENEGGYEARLMNHTLIMLVATLVVLQIILHLQHETLAALLSSLLLVVTATRVKTWRSLLIVASVTLTIVVLVAALVAYQVPTALPLGLAIGSALMALAPRE